MLININKLYRYPSIAAAVLTGWVWPDGLVWPDGRVSNEETIIASRSLLPRASSEASRSAITTINIIINQSNVNQ